MFFKYSISALALIALAACACVAATIVGPTPYLSIQDTPEGVYSKGQLQMLQDFESPDGPWEMGFSFDVGQRIGPKFISGAKVPVTDSVDLDDGIIDGSSTMGSSWFTDRRQINITFDHGVPAASFVLTDADRTTKTVTVEAYGIDGKLLVSGVYGSSFDDVYTGTTEEDRFFGISAMGDEMIKRVFVGINSPSTGIELDHVRFAKAVVPEPTSCILAICAFSCLSPFRRRRQPDISS